MGGLPSALGFRAHTGWAAVVGLSGPLDAPELVCRRRVDLLPADLPAALYHAARPLPPERAASLVAAGTRAAMAAADRALAEVLAELAAAGRRAVGTAVLVGTVRIPERLEAILASHAMLHAAEGALFREALLSASEARGLATAAVPERELQPVAAAALARDPAALAAHLAVLGRAAGTPWGQDQKLAALAAWTALAARS